MLSCAAVVTNVHYGKLRYSVHNRASAPEAIAPQALLIAVCQAKYRLSATVGDRGGRRPGLSEVFIFGSARLNQPGCLLFHERKCCCCCYLWCYCTTLCLTCYCALACFLVCGRAATRSHTPLHNLSGQGRKKQRGEKWHWPKSLLERTGNRLERRVSSRSFSGPIYFDFCCSS